MPRNSQHVEHVPLVTRLNIDSTAVSKADLDMHVTRPNIDSTCLSKADLDMYFTIFDIVSTWVW